MSVQLRVNPSIPAAARTIVAATGAWLLSLAIPSNLAVWVVDQLRTHGQVRRSTIGITTVSAPPSYDAQVGLPPAQVKVTDIRQGSPAEKAGLRVEDVILAFDGTKIPDSGLLEELVQQQGLGSKHRLEFMRRGKTDVVEVVTEQAATPAEVANDDWMYNSEPAEVVPARYGTSQRSEVLAGESFRVAGDLPP